MSFSAKEASWDPETGHPRRWLILAALVLAMFIVQVDQSGRYLALPHIQLELEASPQQLQWVVDAYSLTLAGVVLTAGALSDRLGRRRVFLAGLTVFAAASAVGALAQHMDLVIAARAVMGLGAAMFMPGTLSILTQVFSPSSRAQAIGIWGGASSLGVIVGPLIGGAALQAFDWRAIFWLNVAVALVAFLASAALVPESRDPHPRRVDLPAALLSSAGLLGITYGIISSSEHGLWTVPTLGAIIAGGILLVWFWRHSARRPDGMFDVAVARTRSFQGASIAAAGVMFTMAGLQFVITQKLQLSLGYGTLLAGLAILPLAAAAVVSSALAPVLAARITSRATMTGGMVLVAAAGAAYGLMQHLDGYLPVLACLILIGLGMGFVMVPAQDVLMSSGPLTRSGLISSMNDTVQEVGTALGIAVVGAVLNLSYTHALRAAAPEAPADSLTATLSETTEPALRNAALDAFATASQHAGLAAAGIALLVAILIAVRLGRSQAQPPEGDSGAPEGEQTSDHSAS